MIAPAAAMQKAKESFLSNCKKVEPQPKPAVEPEPVNQAPIVEEKSQITNTHILIGLGLALVVLWHLGNK
jgi:hypothetical protein